MKKLIVYDLDGTLAESKSSLDAEMAARLHDLLGIVKVAVISGGGWPQFEKQLLANLPHAEEAGVVCIPVQGPHETKRVTEAIIACLDGDH